MMRLQQIQVTAQQVAEAMSSVLGMDVTVVDETMVRVAGTGQHTRTIGQKIFGNSVFHKVLQNGDEYVITNINLNSDCNDCQQRGSCLELAQVCCPIVLGSEVIGVIGLIAFSPEQQEVLGRRQEQLLVFTRKMAELIAAKAAEQDTLHRMILLKNQTESVLNFITEGVVAINQAAQIITINEAAEKMLNVKAVEAVGFPLQDCFPATPIPEVLRTGKSFIKQEVNLWHKGKQHRYVINARPMLFYGEVQGVVASFHEIYSAPDEVEWSSKDPEEYTFENIVGSSECMDFVKSEAGKVAATHSTVMLLGESGTGKEVFAKAIHFASERAGKPFIAVNCAAIPETLLESEMFGYEEGAFSGAKKGGKIGKFQMADHGTLFLDEIGDMPLALQAKMLRVLQEKVVERVGGTKSQRVDVRLIVATNRNLEDMIAEGRFREDLYYRLNVFPIILPPLRQRKGDVLLLARYFLQKYADMYEKNASSFSKEAQAALEKYPWPGNIRELENVIECTVIKLAQPIVEIEDLPARIFGNFNRPPTLKECDEKLEIIRALNLYGYSVQGKQQAAELLGVGIATLYRKIRKYNL